MEEELGPADEIESDRQQRVYRGQPPTLGQVARDRDGIAKHANALQVTPNLDLNFDLISNHKQTKVLNKLIRR